MSKTIRQALKDEIFYPLSEGFIDNKLIERGLEAEAQYTQEVTQSKGWKGALADCLISLIQSTSLSEADKSIGSLTNDDKERLLRRARRLLNDIGEELEDESGLPMVYIL